MSVLFYHVSKATYANIPASVDLMRTVKKHAEDCGATESRMFRIAAGGIESGMLVATIEWPDLPSFGRGQDALLASTTEVANVSDEVSTAIAMLVSTEIPVPGATIGEPLPAMLSFAFDARDQRIAEAIENAVALTAPLGEYGGRNIRMWSVLFGGDATNMVMTNVEFEDLEAACRFMETTTADEDYMRRAAAAGGPFGASGPYRSYALSEIPL